MLKDRAILVYYSATQPKQQAVDKQASTEVTENKGAERNAAKVIKVLWDEKQYAPLKRHYNAVRAWFYATTLPWLDNGLRVRPTKGYIEWAAQFRAYRDELDRLSEEFVDAYSDRILREQSRLGGLFRRADYPDPSELRRQFAIEMAIYPVPDSSDFRLDSIGDEAEATVIKAEADARSLQALQETTAACYQRLHKVVKHLADELARTDKVKFHDSLVDNIRDLLKILPELNIAEDGNLDLFIAEVDRKLAAVAVDDIKKDDGLRADVAKDARAIADRLALFM